MECKTKMHFALKSELGEQFYWYELGLAGLACVSEVGWQVGYQPARLAQLLSMWSLNLLADCSGFVLMGMAGFQENDLPYASWCPDSKLADCHFHLIPLAKASHKAIPVQRGGGGGNMLQMYEQFRELPILISSVFLSLCYRKWAAVKGFEREIWQDLMGVLERPLWLEGG